MAVLQTIRKLFVAAEPSEHRDVVPAPPAEYSIKPLTEKNIKEVLKLNFRCFQNGENYTKHTFLYLLNEPGILSYQIVTEHDEMAAFAFVMVTESGMGHLTTIGVAPEHRRRNLARKLLEHLETALTKRDIYTMMLEVRVGNTDAQNLYLRSGYAVTQRIENYYHNGEACFLMFKSLTAASAAEAS